nr:hypothetical protein [uncultured bacterium]
MVEESVRAYIGRVWLRVPFEQVPVRPDIVDGPMPGRSQVVMTSKQNQATSVTVRSHIDFSAEQFLMFVLDEMAYQYEQEYDDVIRLTLGKSELPVDQSITDAMAEAVHSFKKNTLVFPAGLPQLREKLARHESQRNGTEVQPNNVVVSVGTSTMFRNLFALLTGEGDEALLPLPYYPLYRFSAMLAGATVRYYRIDLAVIALRSRVVPETGQ